MENAELHRSVWRHIAGNHLSLRSDNHTGRRQDSHPLPSSRSMDRSYFVEFHSSWPIHQNEPLLPYDILIEYVVSVCRGSSCNKVEECESLDLYRAATSLARYEALFFRIRQFFSAIEIQLHAAIARADRKHPVIPVPVWRIADHHAVLTPSRKPSANASSTPAAPRRGAVAALARDW